MQYVLLEDSVVDTANQTVSYTTEHFSTYLLIDKQIWLDAWRMDLDYDEGMPDEEGKTYDIMICLDYSVSAEELELEKLFAQRLIEQMIEGDRVRIGVYSPAVSDVYYQAEWIGNSTAALRCLETIEEDIKRQYGVIIQPTGTHVSKSYRAIRMLTEMVDKKSSNAKIGFLVNAGVSEKSYFASNDERNAEQNLQSLGFPVHSVSVTKYEIDELKTLLATYGGKSFKATTYENMLIQFRNYGASPDDEVNMADTDGDGLYDTYEVNGMRIQNGTIVYTDPYEKDTDGDGINDFDEVGGLPQYITSPAYEYACLINYQVSDPNDPNSTGKQLDRDYMFVDNMSYLPYDKETYERIFVTDTTKYDANGEKIYGLYNIYNSNPAELTEEQVEELRTKVEIQCFGVGQALALPATFLKKYIYNTDERNFYLCEGVLRRNASVRQNLANEAWYMMVAAQEYLDANETIMITQTPDNQNGGVELVPFRFEWNKNDGPNVDFGLGDFLGIHYAKSRLVSKVSFDGTNYTMDLKYYLFDYYDWDEDQTARLGLVSDSQLYKMCRCGAARFYENWGVYETRITWNLEADSGQNALEAEKNYLSIPFAEN